MTAAEQMLKEMKETMGRVQRQIHLLIAELEATGLDHRDAGWRDMEKAIRTDERLKSLREVLGMAAQLNARVQEIK